MKKDFAAATSVAVAIIVMVVAMVAMCATPARAEGTREKEGFKSPGGAIMAGVSDALHDLDAGRIESEQLVLDRPDRKVIKVKIKTDARITAGRTAAFPLAELSVSARRTDDGMWRVDETWVSYSR